MTVLVAIIVLLPPTVLLASLALRWQRQSVDFRDGIAQELAAEGVLEEARARLSGSRYRSRARRRHHRSCPGALARLDGRVRISRAADVVLTLDGRLLEGLAAGSADLNANRRRRRGPGRLPVPQGRGLPRRDRRFPPGVASSPEALRGSGEASRWHTPDAGFDAPPVNPLHLLDSSLLRPDSHRFPDETGEEAALLTLTYVALAVLGAGYLLLSVFLGHSDLGGEGHGDAGPITAPDAHMDYGVDASRPRLGFRDAPHAAEFHFPLLLASRARDAFRLHRRLRPHRSLRVSTADAVSILVAIPAAVVTAYLITYAGWRIVGSSRGSSQIRLQDLAGVHAEVITPIPKDGMGEVAALVEDSVTPLPRGKHKGAKSRGEPSEGSEDGGLDASRGVELMRERAVKERRTPCQWSSFSETYSCWPLSRSSPSRSWGTSSPTSPFSRRRGRTRSSWSPAADG